MIFVELVGAGFGVEALAGAPLESWVAWYRAVKARELERLASLVSVVHAADPKRLRDVLSAESRRIAASGSAGAGRPWYASKDKMIEFAGQFGGRIRVKESG